MKCETYRDWIPLSVYGELSAADEDALQQHLAGCDGCQAELDVQRRLMEALDSRVLAPSADLVAQCRAGLMRELDRVAVPAPAAAAPVRSGLGESMAHLRDGFRSFFAALRPLRQPIAAVALVALGYFGARIGSTGAGGNDNSFFTVRSIQPDASGRVQIALDETRRRVVSGGLEDDNVRRILLAAARDEENPGLRVESIRMLTQASGEADVQRALLAALTNDTNPGVRLKALEGLKSFAAEPDVRRELSRALLVDENPGVRVQIIDLLTQKKNQDIVGVLQSLVEKEDNNYVLMKCQKALKEMNASLGTF